MRRSTLCRGKWSWTTWRNSETQYERLVVGSRADPCILSFKAGHMDADQPRHVKEVVAKAVRPNWKALAAEFAAGRLTDADGKAPSGETKTDVVEGSQDSRCPTGIGHQAQGQGVGCVRASRHATPTRPSTSSIVRSRCLGPRPPRRRQSVAQAQMDTNHQTEVRLFQWPPSQRRKRP
jgi:hypothetical protein